MRFFGVLLLLFLCFVPALFGAPLVPIHNVFTLYYPDHGFTSRFYVVFVRPTDPDELVVLPRLSPELRRVFRERADKAPNAEERKRVIAEEFAAEEKLYQSLLDPKTGKISKSYRQAAIERNVRESGLLLNDAYLYGKKVYLNSGNFGSVSTDEEIEKKTLPPGFDAALRRSCSGKQPLVMLVSDLKRNPRLQILKTISVAYPDENGWLPYHHRLVGKGIAPPPAPTNRFWLDWSPAEPRHYFDRYDPQVREPAADELMSLIPALTGDGMDIEITFYSSDPEFNVAVGRLLIRFLISWNVTRILPYRIPGAAFGIDGQSSFEIFSHGRRALESLGDIPQRIRRDRVLRHAYFDVTIGTRPLFNHVWVNRVIAEAVGPFSKRAYASQFGLRKELIAPFPDPDVPLDPKTGEGKNIHLLWGFRTELEKEAADNGRWYPADISSAYPQFEYSSDIATLFEAPDACGNVLLQDLNDEIVRDSWLPRYPYLQVGPFEALLEPPNFISHK